MKNFEAALDENAKYTEFAKELNSAFVGELAIRFNNETIMLTSFSLNWVGNYGYVGRENYKRSKQNTCFPVLLMSFIFDGKVETVTFCPDLRIEMFEQLYDNLSSDIENFKNEQQKKQTTIRHV